MFVCEMIVCHSQNWLGLKCLSTPRHWLKENLKYLKSIQVSRQVLVGVSFHGFSSNWSHVVIDHSELEEREENKHRAG